jgi:hypothetical protein
VPQKGRIFSSHKFKKKSGVRYEVALKIFTGEIAWLNGPFPCGKFSDVTIFRASLSTFLDDFERVEADDGYIGESPFRAKVPKAVLSCPSEADALQKRVQGRHETINARLKHFAILEERFRHDITQHGYVFRAVAVLVQLSIKNGDPLFNVNYKCAFKTYNVNVKWFLLLIDSLNIGLNVK